MSCPISGNFRKPSVRRYESTTKIERKAASELNYPAISICHQALIAESTISNDPEVVSWLSRIMSAQWRNDESIPEDEWDEAESYLRQHNLLYSMFAHLPRVIVACTVNVEQPCWHLFDVVLSDSGLCITLQGRESIERYGQLAATRPGADTGIGMYIFSSHTILNTCINDFRT